MGLCDTTVNRERKLQIDMANINYPTTPWATPNWVDMDTVNTVSFNRNPQTKERPKRKNKGTKRYAVSGWDPELKFKILVDKTDPHFEALREAGKIGGCSAVHIRLYETKDTGAGANTFDELWVVLPGELGGEDDDDSEVEMVLKCADHDIPTATYTFGEKELP